MDERPTDRTVTLVVPLPDRTGRTTGAPYVERTDRTAERPPVRTEPERPPVREPDETVGAPAPVRPERTLQWQTVTAPTVRLERTLPGDSGRTHLKIAVASVPATAAAGAVCGLVSSLWPLAVLAGTAAVGALLALLVRFARWLTDSIAGETQ